MIDGRANDLPGARQWSSQARLLKSLSRSPSEPLRRLRRRIIALLDQSQQRTTRPLLTRNNKVAHIHYLIPNNYSQSLIVINSETHTYLLDSALAWPSASPCPRLYEGHIVPLYAHIAYACCSLTTSRYNPRERITGSSVSAKSTASWLLDVLICSCTTQPGTAKMSC